MEHHAHPGEEGLYVLEGAIEVRLEDRVELLQTDDFAFIDAGVRHALASIGPSGARWLEVSAPPPTSALPTAFAFNGGVEAPNPGSEFRSAHFDIDAMPAPADALVLPGFGASIVNASLKMLIDREFGASQFNLMTLQYVPGGLIKEHDHAFEEAYFFTHGEIEAVLDGQTYVLTAGDACWCGVGSVHSFQNRSTSPTRWLETQVPQPPTRYAARFRENWASRARL